jgi:hypothetical protein
MAAWLSKWGPLAGVLSGILVVASFSTGSGSPSTGSSGSQVIQWYQQHGHQVLSDALFGLALFFLIIFVAALSRHIRRGDSWLAQGALAGAACLGIGGLLPVGVDLVLARDTKYLTPASAQTLNLLDNDFVLPFVLGIALLGILGGLAVVAGRILPAWMGWALFALGVAGLVPPLSFLAYLATTLWVIVAGIWMAVQGPPAVTAEPAVAQERVLA